MNGTGGTNPTMYCYPSEGLHYNCGHKEKKEALHKCECGKYSGTKHGLVTHKRMVHGATLSK